jgi:DNA-binding GntR family transcriptional regulator
MPSKRGPQAFVEHGHIADAIERRDPEMAELMMRSHIRASRQNVERLLAGRQ